VIIGHLNGKFRDPRFATAFVLMFALMIAARFLGTDFLKRTRQAVPCLLFFLRMEYGFSCLPYNAMQSVLSCIRASNCTIAIQAARTLQSAKRSGYRIAFRHIGARHRHVVADSGLVRRPWSEPYRTGVSSSSGSARNVSLGSEKPIGYVVPLLSMGSGLPAVRYCYAHRSRWCS